MSVGAGDDDDMMGLAPVKWIPQCAHFQRSHHAAMDGDSLPLSLRVAMQSTSRRALAPPAAAL